MQMYSTSVVILTEVMSRRFNHANYLVYFFNSKTKILGKYGLLLI